MEKKRMNTLTLKTDRLNLKPISENDINNIHKLHSLPETDAFNTLGIPKSILETEIIVEGWISENNSENNKKYTFTIELNKEEEFIGLIGINLGKEKYRNAEVWFKIDCNYWNKGYATEATTFWLDHGFKTKKITTMNAYTHAENGASNHILEKAGFQEMETYYNDDYIAWKWWQFENKLIK
jgi:RimJ/RimL family protein N-acetyltransferase